MPTKDFSGLNANLIHQLKKKIEEINEEKERLRVIFDSANDGMLIADMGTKKFFLGNRAICKMLGYSLDEIKQLGVLDIHPKKDLPYVLGQFKKQSSREIDVARIPIKRKDGSVFYADVNAAPLIINGKPHLLGVFRDVTEKRKAEYLLKASERKYRTLFESSRDAIMTIAPPSWGFTSGNPATVKMFNAKNEKEFISKGPWDVSPKRQPDGQISTARAKKMIEKAMKDGSNFFEWTHKRINGEDFPATVLLSRIDLDGKSLIQATVRDITELKKTEEELTILKKAVEASGEVIFLTDIDGLITYVNLEFTKVYGYRADEVVGKTTPRILKSGVMKRKDYLLFWKTILNKQVARGEIINKTKKGKSITMVGSANPILDENKKIIGFLAIQRAKEK